MSSPGEIRAQFTEMVRRPEPRIELARAALLVAAESDPALDVEAAVALLHEWGTTLASRVDPQWNSLQRLARLRNYVFDELGFRGDVEHYHNPANSLLHSVMVRRTGIPLTLAIVFMELGWRIGLALEGVSFPGHFLVRLAGEPGDLLLDPFSHGTSVHEDDCRRMLADSTGGRVAFDPAMTRSVSRRDVIARLLYNLKVALLRAGDAERALSAIERLLIVVPGSPPELRDRGLLLYRLDRYAAALESLRAYCEARPDAFDREHVERQMTAIRMMLGSAGH